MLFLDSENVVSNGLGDWSALSDGEDISDSNSLESWGKMGRKVVMSLLESVIFLDIMEVISSQDDSSSHLGGKDDTFTDSSSDRNVRSEWAFLVNVLTLHGVSWGFETESNLFVISVGFVSLLGEDFFRVIENSKLLLKGSFVLEVSHVFCYRKE